MCLLGSQPDESSPCLLPHLHGIRSVSEANSGPGQKLCQAHRLHQARQAFEGEHLQSTSVAAPGMGQCRLKPGELHLVMRPGQLVITLDLAPYLQGT